MVRKTCDENEFHFSHSNYFRLEQLRQKSRHAAGHLYLPKGVKAVPVDSKEYTKLNPSNIPADEKFLYTFDRFLNFRFVHLIDFIFDLDL